MVSFCAIIASLFSVACCIGFCSIFDEPSRKVRQTVHTHQFELLFYNAPPAYNAPPDYQEIVKI